MIFSNFEPFGFQKGGWTPYLNKNKMCSKVVFLANEYVTKMSWQPLNVFTNSSPSCNFICRIINSFKRLNI